jgi:NADH-quinone oxidoreductase subunit N
MLPISVNPLGLEFAVILLGVLLIVLEAFRTDLAAAAVKAKDPLTRSLLDNFRAEEFNKSMALIAIAGLAVVLVCSFGVRLGPEAVKWPPAALDFYAIDAKGLFFKQFALLSTIIVLVMAIDYLPVLEKFAGSDNSRHPSLGEFFAIPVFTCAGLMFMASAKDLIMIFVSLELVTMSFYILVTFMRRNVGSLEAGVKYLILGALSTGFLVYGLTWVFGATGETSLAKIRDIVPVLGDRTTALLFGYGLLVVGLGFKIAAVPFQIWVPDVYQGAPTPVTAYLSVASKAAGFIVFMRVAESFQGFSPELTDKILGLFVFLAVATLIYGNLGAIPQTNVKRLLAYSSIAHAGYLLIGIACFYAPEGSKVGGIFTGPAVAYYLWAYLLMTLLCFLCIVVVARSTGGDDLRNFNGLAKRSPFLTAAMIVAMLSLAGIPFTAGFLGKLYIFSAAVERGQLLLCIVGVLSVAAGFYYYLKVIRAMCLEAPEVDGTITIGAATKLVMGVLIAATIIFGLYSAPITRLFE